MEQVPLFWEVQATGQQVNRYAKNGIAKAWESSGIYDRWVFIGVFLLLLPICYQLLLLGCIPYPSLSRVLLFYSPLCFFSCQYHNFYWYPSTFDTTS